MPPGFKSMASGKGSPGKMHLYHLAMIHHFLIKKGLDLHPKRAILIWRPATAGLFLYQEAVRSPFKPSKS
jgi:hypothetical protein